MQDRLKSFLIIFFILLTPVYSDYTYPGTIDTIRGNSYLTVIFSKTPGKDEYYIINNEKIIGKIYSLKEIPGIYGQKRFLCRYSLLNEDYRKLIRPGLDIGYYEADKEIDKSSQKSSYINTPVYKTEIISPVDRRDMVLIPEGKFLMGCNICENDEYPEHIEFLGNYYIDKFEVSNSNYKEYADIKGLKYPDYWSEYIDEKMDFKNRYFAGLPVIVTYYEALGYAQWAKKRLPTEKEWEKAARLPAAMDTGGKNILYSWGSEFKDGLANTEEFWLNIKTGENLKKIISDNYGLITPEKGYIPVDIYEKDSLTYYGVAHMDGNASEWTGSWYKPYPLNKQNSKNYGEQYKVIRGGSYISSKSDSRITARKIGGIPDLYTERAAGFRCVKSPAENDKK